MYIESIPNRSSPPAILLRESFREGGRVGKRTLANLSAWPTELVEGLRTLGGVEIEDDLLRWVPMCFQKQIDKQPLDLHPITILSTLPSAGVGAALELRRPLGITIVGGLLVSQLLTLYTTPVIYLYLDRLRLWTRRPWRTGGKVPRERPFGYARRAADLKHRSARSG